jgi:1,2-diacylglycerol 3-beta-glucosyltransferase
MTGRSRPGVPRRSQYLALLAIGLAVAAITTFGAATVLQMLVVGLLAVFLLFFVRHLAFALCATQFAPADLAAPVIDTGFAPTVSVLVGCRNEALVVENLVAALGRLDYPSNRLQAIVVDDGSDDATGPLLDQMAATRPWLTVLHRKPGSPGGKSGALNTALDCATGEIIVIFDADHRPRPDVLKRLVRHFEDQDVAAVQGRCVVHNGDSSRVARLIATDYLAGYLVNEYGRQAIFQLPAYGGANCAVRADDLRRLGGWNERSVTEDTDLTVRLALAGRKVRYDITAVDEEEAVTTVRRYWRQRYRWARGHQQVSRDYRGLVWRCPHFTFAQKVETTMFLLAFHLPAVALAGLLLWPVARLMSVPVLGDPVGGFALWALLYIGPLVELGAGLLIARAPRRRALDIVLFVPLYLVSMVLCSKALLDSMRATSYTWNKTLRQAPAVSGGAQR